MQFLVSEISTYSVRLNSRFRKGRKDSRASVYSYQRSDERGSIISDIGSTDVQNM